MVTKGEVVRIGIIGAGRTGTPLIKEFLQFPYIKIMGVCDLNLNTEGMRLARDNGIFTTANIEDIVNMGEEIDLVINVSGDPNLRKRLVNFYLRTANAHTIIVHEMVARLMISLAERSASLKESLHPHVRGL